MLPISRIRKADRFRARAAALLLLAAMLGACAERSPTMTYPETRRGDIVEVHFGVAVADPYRWLEADIRRDPEVAAWVKAQDDATRAYLDRLPGREALRARLAALHDHERVIPPQKAGGRYFLAQDPVGAAPERLVMRETLGGRNQIPIPDSPRQATVTK